MGKILYDVNLRNNTVDTYDEKFYKKKHKDDFKKLLDLLLDLKRTTGADIKLVKKS